MTDTAIAALLIGGVGGYIAYQQYKVAHAKLKLDLFARRYEIFEKTWAYLSAPVQVGPPESGFSAPFQNLIPQASFLFGKEIEDYMNEASRQLTELWMIGLRTKARQDVMPPTDIQRHTDILNWFVIEAQRGAKARFAPYLDFSTWRA